MTDNIGQAENQQFSIWSWHDSLQKSEIHFLPANENKEKTLK